MSMRLAGAAAGLLLDRAVGEIPVEPHPVAAFGRAMQRVEDRWWHDDRRAGVRYAIAGLTLGATAGLALGSTAIATAMSVAGRMLGEVALEIGGHLESGNLDAARTALPALVGRDPSVLDEHGIARAVVESVAENTVDAIVAPVWWGAMAGASGVLAHRAVNTMDAMVGHRNARYEHFGWASARVDDALNYIPARITALLVMAARPRAARHVVRVVRRDAAEHPSPNAGVAEAAFAAALGVTLGGRNVYGERVEHRPEMGDGAPPTRHDIGRAVELSSDVSAILAGTLLAGAAALHLWRRVA